MDYIKVKLVRIVLFELLMLNMDPLMLKNTFQGFPFEKKTIEI